MAVDDDEAGDAAAQQAANQAAKRIKAAAKGGAAPGGGNGAAAAAGEGEDEDDMAKYNLDAYDDEVSGSTGASLSLLRARSNLLVLPAKLTLVHRRSQQWARSATSRA